jgi:hypothetical protein
MKGRRGGTRLLARLLARQVWADRGVVVLLALVVAGTAFLAAAVPRQVDDVSTRALRTAVADAGPLSRGITGSAVVPPLPPLSTAPEDPAAPYAAVVGRVDAGPGASLAPWGRSPEWDVRTVEWWMTGRSPRPGPASSRAASPATPRFRRAPGRRLPRRGRVTSRPWPARHP